MTGALAINDPTCYDQSKLNTNNTAFPIASPVFSQDFASSAHENFDTSIYSYGNYYNWYSATAGNGKQETGSDTTVTGDICPTGWGLPIGGSPTTENGSFSNLDTTMGGTGGYQNTTEASNKWRSFPNNFVYSGYRNNSSASNRGYKAHYWSSTANNTHSAHTLTIGSGNVSPGGGITTIRTSGILHAA